MSCGSNPPPITPPTSSGTQSLPSSPPPTTAKEHRERKRTVTKLRRQTDLTDDQLFQVLSKAYEEDTILLPRDFTKHYIHHDWLTDEEASCILWCSAKRRVFSLIRDTSVFGSSYGSNSDGRGVLKLLWKDSQPTLPEGLHDNPMIMLEKSDDYIDNIRLDIGR